MKCYVLSGYPHSDPPSYPFLLAKKVLYLYIKLHLEIHPSFYRLETKQTLSNLGQKSFIEKDVFSVNDTSDSEETNPSTSCSVHS